MISQENIKASTTEKVIRLKKLVRPRKTQTIIQPVSIDLLNNPQDIYILIATAHKTERAVLDAIAYLSKKSGCVIAVSHDSIAAHIDKSPSRVKHWLSVLERKYLIVVEWQGVKKINHYRLASCFLSPSIQAYLGDLLPTFSYLKDSGLDSKLKYARKSFSLNTQNELHYRGVILKSLASKAIQHNLLDSCSTRDKGEIVKRGDERCQQNEAACLPLLNFDKKGEVITLSCATKNLVYFEREPMGHYLTEDELQVYIQQYQQWTGCELRPDQQEKFISFDEEAIKHGLKSCRKKWEAHEAMHVPFRVFEAAAAGFSLDRLKNAQASLTAPKDVSALQAGSYSFSEPKRSLKEQIAQLEQDEINEKKFYTENKNYKNHLKTPFKDRSIDWDLQGRIHSIVMNSPLWAEYKEALTPQQRDIIGALKLKLIEEAREKAEARWDSYTDEQINEAQVEATKIMYTDRKCPTIKNKTWLSLKNKIDEIRQYRIEMRRKIAEINPHIYRYDEADGELYYVKTGDCAVYGVDDHE